MPNKAATAIVFLSGAILAVLVSPGATHLLPAGNAVRDTSPLPVLRTQGWLQDLFGGSGWEPPRSRTLEDDDRKPEEMERKHRHRRSIEGSEPSHAGRPATGGYRTLCVRLCDGFYWPISYSTIRARFPRDAKQCETGCPGRSQLFVQRSGSDDVEGMVDLKGIPYTQLKNALRYRTEYVQDCTCRGNPWDAEAIARHRAYAETAKSASENPAGDKKQSHDTKTKSQFGPWARADLEARD
jgi:hypothetical protein